MATEKELDGWLLFPTNDQQLSAISNNHKLLSKYYKIGFPDSNIIDNVLNKKLTYKIAKNLNINQPKTFFPKDKNSLLALSKKISYPCIIKPAIMHNFFIKTKKKAILCRNKSELIKNYNHVSKLIQKKEIMVQDLIPGSPVELYSFCTYFKENISYLPLVAKRAAASY